jgi:predicted Zn-dependent protease
VKFAMLIGKTEEDRAGRIAGNEALKDTQTEKVIALIQQADLQVKSGNLASAQKLISQALQFFPEHPRLIVSRGNISLQLNEIKAAHQDFANASVLDPQFAPALVGLATVQMSMNQFENAEATILRVLSLEPDNPKAQEIYAQLCIRLNRLRSSGSRTLRNA